MLSNSQQLNIEDIIATEIEKKQRTVCLRDAERIDHSSEQYEVKIDHFVTANSASLFLRLLPGNTSDYSFFIAGSYTIVSTLAGGWLLLPDKNTTTVSYWIPRQPMLRSLDKDGHIISEKTAPFLNFNVTPNSLEVGFDTEKEHCLDIIIWQFSESSTNLINELSTVSTTELSNYYLWGSHTLYSKPADLFLHLIHGHIYENRTSWPFYWKICSENDAHALFVTLNGLHLATNKKIYHLLKQQILLSIIDRQSDDGGWRHGEWSKDMESHYRLHCSGMHTLMDALSYEKDTQVQQALDKAADFISQQTDKMDSGYWFLHDELEHSPELMNKGPFKWVPSNVLGKSPSNMLVLNTQLDTFVALDRYQQISDLHKYDELLASAKNALLSVLKLKTANWLYGPLFNIIADTLLPKKSAQQLSTPRRALKRIGWKYLIPKLQKIKSKYPRLVMPNGYIDRALSVGGLSDAYLSINVMDLLRYYRRQPQAELMTIIENAIEFGEKNKIRQFWCENPKKIYALGFWAEAMFHMSTLKDDIKYRKYLAETMQMLFVHKLGMPASLLGGNAEAINPADQKSTLHLTQNNLLIANLSRHAVTEYLFVNTSTTTHKVNSNEFSEKTLEWLDASGNAITSDCIEIPGRKWVLAKSTR